MGKIQRIAMWAITGGLWTSPNDLLDVHAGVLPVNLMLECICHSAVVRTATLPASHPLQSMIRGYSKTPAKTHLSPLQKLIKRFKIRPRHFETIRPDPRPPMYKRAFTVTIANSKEESIEEEAKDDSDIRIYMDGSGFKGNVGAAAVLYRKGTKELEKVLCYHLGSLKKHTTFKGEAVGSMLAAWMLQGQPEVGQSKITNYTDSQAFIRATGVRKSGPGQYLVMEYLSLTEAMNNDANTLHSTGTAKFALSWVAVHKRVAGNKRVDEEAKKAVQGESSPLEELPPILHKRLPYSASAVKQEFVESQKVRWREAWQGSPHYARFQHVDPDFPFNKFRKLSERLSRSQASLMMQLWMGHIPLNSYLHCIKKSATRRCESCWGIVRWEVTETVIHFLFECQAYAAEQYNMDRVLGHQSRDLQGIMASLDGVVEVCGQNGQVQENTQGCPR